MKTLKKNTKSKACRGLWRYRMQVWVGLFVLALSACSVKPYVPEGEVFYGGVKDINISKRDKKHSRHSARTVGELRKALEVKPNNSLVGSAKYRLPFTYGFYINDRFSDSKSFLGRWLFKTLGDQPKFISTINPSMRTDVARRLLQENGYFNSDVNYTLNHGKDSVQATITYDIVMNQPHLIDSVEYRVPIVLSDSTALFDPEETLVQKGDPFSVVMLEEERQRVTELLRDKGYFYFQPSNIVYEADTTIVAQKVQLRVKLSDQTAPEAYKPWRIGKISYNIYDLAATPLTDSVYMGNVLVRYAGKKLPVRESILRKKIHFLQDSLYQPDFQNATIRGISTLNTFAYTDASYSQSDSVPGYLDVQLSSQLDLPYYAELESVFKIKSNNQVGPGANFTVSKKNIFRGGELLSLSLGANYEWETQQAKMNGNSWDINSYSFNISNTITFPRILLPYYGNRFHDFPATTSITASASLLNRSSFYRLGQFGGKMTYNFEPRSGIRHSITPLRITYNALMKSTERFDEIMADNPALDLSFQNQFVTAMGYTFAYEHIQDFSPHALSLEVSFSEAGNLLSGAYAIAGRSFHERQKTFLKSPFAQFVKGILEVRYGYRLNSRSKLASRLFAGAVYSYGNMFVAPYAEQFYAGGANSIRAFNVRSLGPGSYSPTEYNIYSFMDRTGDIRLEANLEYRQKVIGDLELAGFLDAGNVWLFRNDPQRPGGTMNAKTFFKDLALGSGLGLRYDFSYLVIRFDVGVALHAPYDTGMKGYFNTINKDIWKSALAYHIAIGYPF